MNTANQRQAADVKKAVIRHPLLLAAAVAAFASPLASSGLSLRAQTPAAATAFEVASVKPNKTGDGRVMVGMAPGGRFTATNVPVRLLLRQAYDVQDFQIVGAPDWLNTDRFDISAKAPEDGNFTGEQMRPMLRSLLEERFKVKVHAETREMAIYSLVKARSDGKLGSALTPAAVDCRAARGRRGGGPPPPLTPGQRPECGMMIGIGRMNAGGMPMSELARTLSQQVGRVVLDKTGLTGGYDFELNYAPESRTVVGAPPQLNGAEVAVDPNAPTLFTALQEQLGLKLESERGPVDVVVIDNIAQPMAD